MQTSPIILTTGEPAGIGPDLCILLYDWLRQQNIVLCGDITLLRQRAKHYQSSCSFHHYDKQSTEKNSLAVLHVPCPFSVEIGHLNIKNASYVLDMLELACQKTIDQTFSAIVTAPVHKGIICEAGFAFSGHTEFFEQQTHAKKTVMCLATSGLKVALMTTHVPLSQVSNCITPTLIRDIIQIITHDFQKYFSKENPKIAVCGLNPHAGEMGFLGKEEIEIINPTLDQLKLEGFHVTNTLAADTIFSKENLNYYDVILSMYHDQGLPVIKALGFGECVNITLGLPIIRTSVDHGTALELAGTQKISTQSLKQAILVATQMSQSQL